MYVSSAVRSVREGLWRLEERLANRRAYPLMLHANRVRLPGVVEERVAYGPHPRQYVLWFQPAAAAPQRGHAVLFLHGGGWEGGEPTFHRYVARFFVARGFPTALAGYRLAPEHTFPAQLDDARAALALTARLSGEAGRSGRVIVAGQSAGAQLAALLVLAQERRQGHGLTGEAVAGAVLLGGVLNFNACRDAGLRRQIDRYLGADGNRVMADPIRQLRGPDHAAILCIHGSRDPIVELGSAAAFVRSANAAQPGSARLLVARGAHHADVTRLFYRRTPERAALERWLTERERDSST